MQLRLDQEFKDFSDRKIKSKNVILTERDAEIIEFIIEMKFAAIEDVFEKFFKVKQNQTDAKSDLWARKRLLQLEQGRFLKAHKLHQEKTTFYTATFKGYYAISNLRPDKLICKPIGGFDSRTYGHDRTVLKCRLALESHLRITNWISDRKLKSYPELTGGLSTDQVPDGIFALPAGQSVALELEIARKAKVRYQNKVRRYVALMRSTDTSRRKFENVIFVCAKTTVKDLLVAETKIYGKLFKVFTTSEFINALIGAKNEIQSA